MALIKGKHLAKGMKTIDMRTGEEKPSTGTMFMLGPKPGVCQQCAVDHKPEFPHDASSLAYQYWFFNEHGRWPNWIDAMAHCDQPMKENWTKALKEKGIDVEGGKVYPRSDKK